MIHLDNEGYPTEEVLDYIRNYDVTAQSVRPLIELIRSLWQFRDWGFEIEDHIDDFKSVDSVDSEPYYHKHKRLYISTGGWSGNESIIEALRQNKWFFCLYWVQERRGGHFVFEISYKNWFKTKCKNKNEILALTRCSK